VEASGRETEEDWSVPIQVKSKPQLVITGTLGDRWGLDRANHHRGQEKLTCARERWGLGRERWHRKIYDGINRGTTCANRKIPSNR